MAIYDSIDLDWTWDGDYLIDDQGDVKDTSDDLLKSLITEVTTICKSETLDWEKNISVGANLSDFQGEPNVRETGKAIEQRIKSKIVDLNIVQSGDITVKVIPVHIHQILVNILITAQPTSRNKLGYGERLRVSLAYDTIENSVFFLLDETPSRPV